jgi:hypothetical protein
MYRIAACLIFLSGQFAWADETVSGVVETISVVTTKYNQEIVTIAKLKNDSRNFIVRNGTAGNQNLALVSPLQDSKTSRNSLTLLIGTWSSYADPFFSSDSIGYEIKALK